MSLQTSTKQNVYHVGQLVQALPYYLDGITGIISNIEIFNGTEWHYTIDTRCHLQMLLKESDIKLLK